MFKLKKKLVHNSKGSSSHKKYWRGTVIYTVNGQQYSHDVETEKRLRDGQPITVLYNDTNPAESIIPRLETSSMLLKIIGISFLTLSAVIFISGVLALVRARI